MKNSVSDKLIAELRTDGFEISKFDSQVVAKKNQDILIINKHNEVQKKTDYAFLLNQSKYKLNKVAGVPFSEIRKLLKYELKQRKSLFDTFLKICSKYNWVHTYFSDYYIDDNTSIKYIEIETDESSSLVTFVFIEDKFSDSFVIMNLKGTDLLSYLNKMEVKHLALSAIAPNFYKAINSN